jgi:hypothetical protein
MRNNTEAEALFVMDVLIFYQADFPYHEAYSSHPEPASFDKILYNIIPGISDTCPTVILKVKYRQCFLNKGGF